MPSSNKKKPQRQFRLGWLVLPLGAALTVLVAAGAGVAYAAHIENKDAFCASCHTEPESRYFTQSQATPVDLATAHSAKGVECIQVALRASVWYCA